MLTGIALLPQLEDSLSLIRFRTEHTDIIEGPKIGSDQFPPHISLLQAPMTANAVNESMLQSIMDSFNVKDFVLMADQIRYQQASWLFLDLIQNPHWLQLQAAVMEKTIDLIDTDEIDHAKDMSSYSEAEQQSYLQYGYRYVGTAFRPHITLGRLDAVKQEQAAGLANAFQTEIGHWESTPRSLVFYIAGSFGVIEKIVAQVPW